MREQTRLGFLGLGRTAGRALRIIAFILQVKRPRGNPKNPNRCSGHAWRRGSCAAGMPLASRAAGNVRAGRAGRNIMGVNATLPESIKRYVDSEMERPQPRWVQEPSPGVVFGQEPSGEPDPAAVLVAVLGAGERRVVDNAPPWESRDQSLL